MNPEPTFLGFLGLTVALLIAVAITGKRGRLRAHLVLVFAALCSLALAIYFALQVGQRYDLEAAGAITPIHMTMARVATASYLLPLVTGLLTLRDRRHRRLHGRFAAVVVVLTVAATVTGALMLLMAPRIAS